MGRPGQLGGTLSAVSQRSETHDWDSIASADYDPQRNRIHIRLKRLGWFGRDTIYCHPETYPIASAWVARHIAEAVD